MACRHRLQGRPPRPRTYRQGALSVAAPGLGPHDILQVGQIPLCLSVEHAGHNPLGHLEEAARVAFGENRDPRGSFNRFAGEALLHAPARRSVWQRSSAARGEAIAL